MDLEGAARLGNAVYWIASHGRNASGKFAPNRHRFFALEIPDALPPLGVRRLGLVITNLVDAMAADERLARFQLNAAARRAPKARGGLSIEALTATPEGTLLIGFRNPIPEGRALLVPLLNPNGMLADESPQFGDALLLDLGGYGLRGMASTLNGYYLIAGSADGAGKSALFFWSGGTNVPERVSAIGFDGLNPEAICFPDPSDHTECLILSDDGARKLGGMDCKDLPESERRFRGYRIAL